MIFSRGRGSGRHAKADARRDSAPDPELLDDDFEDDDASGPAFGPYDVSEAPRATPDDIDLGALRIPPVEGVEVSVQTDADGRVMQMVLSHDGSALQLGVFAAPRSEGIWEEVRAEIRKQLFNDGVAAEETDGDYGTELRARVRTPDGMVDIRFVGIDGPRWLVRAVYQGPAAVDPASAEPLRECLRRLVVNRGSEAMPVRDPLPLRLSPEAAERAKVEGAEGADGTEGAEATEGANGSAPGGRPSPGGRRKPSPRPRHRR